MPYAKFLASLTLLFLLTNQLAAFENLDFEQAMPNLTGDPNQDCCNTSRENLLPHWSNETFSSPSSVPFENGAGAHYHFGHIGLSPPLLILFDDLHPSSSPLFDPIQGTYSLLIESLGMITDIFQNGNVPSGSKSIRFSAHYLTSEAFFFPSEDLPADELDVYLGGERLTVVELGSEEPFRKFGANIPTHLIGNPVELRFSARPMYSFFLDDISFSPVPVPEPTTIDGLAIALGSWFGLRRPHTLLAR